MSQYSFSNLCGAPYTGGSVTFSPKGDYLLAPVGNRICVYDLEANKSNTFNSQSRSNIHYLCHHPHKKYAIVIDVNGFAQVLNLLTDTVLHRLQFKSHSNFSQIAINNSEIPVKETQNAVTAAEFSSDGKFFALSCGKKVTVWNSPTIETNWNLHLHREYCGHLDNVTHISWSKTNQFFLTSSRDMTVRLWSVEPLPNFIPSAFIDHRRAVVAAFYDSQEQRIFSISQEGVFISWINKPYSSGDDNALVNLSSKSRNEQLHIYNTRKWVKEKMAYCNQPNNSKITKVAHNQHTNILVVGLTKGLFTIYLLPEFEALHILSIGLPIIDAIDITSDGQWIALACSQTGSLLVWEWKSESYILRQKGHYGPVKSAAFSLNSQGSIRIGAAVSEGLKVMESPFGMGCRYLIATGGIDGKLKLWDTFSGFCFCTFEQHSSSIEDITFVPQGNAVLTASLDGTVCAFDLIRLRLFRIFKPDIIDVQFTCIAVDLSGQIVAAGSKGVDNSIYLWNIQTGNLLERLTGHQGPVTSLKFHTNVAYPGILASTSWDNTAMVWNVFGRQDKGGTARVFDMPSSCLSLSLDPRGNPILATSSLHGIITFWDFDVGEIVGIIEGFRDIQGGRGEGDRFAAFSKHAVGKGGNDLQEGVRRIHHFNSICHSSTGDYLIASSQNAPNICIYSTDTYNLLHSIQLTKNRSLKGILRFLPSNYEPNFNLDDNEYKRIEVHKSLPGVEVGDLKHNRDRFQVSKVCFSSDSRQFAAATSHGLFIYSISTGATAIRTRSASNSLETFQPQLLTKNVTTQNVLMALSEREYGKALVLSLALNQFNTLTRVYLSIPLNEIYKALCELHPSLLPILFHFILKTFTNKNKATTSDTTNSVDSIVGRFFGLRLLWLRLIFTVHYVALASGDLKSKDSMLDNWLGNLQNDLSSTFRHILRNLNREMATLGMTLSSNVAALSVISQLADNNIGGNS
ncbi:PWP2, UTP1, periodic tryptophan protein 2 [Babesia microti strain RI]|uniref:PWP2, UTP1, periodic tryptophan protein 2 n=1 Tax=Babesia microti (strain RI) TaxID=1133968 RepID=A0A1R4AAQ0_BABMR|nr:PWP2, UTP1, periodic tryptophan protein 2 [Babesia microti strain RI]SJK86078.1 PWP2, UTP1, periodic tryptophan protein 2 [Babesia microti strain RI]|eukprot:XP_021338274.1 PWP2, UTP1, periodic tryptophan protein 2 [Babesia microti strain RI]